MNKRKEVNLKDIFYILNKYKLFIFIVMLLFILFTKVYLFFKPSIYSSSATIEVKTQGKGLKLTNDLVENAFYSTSKETDKEIAVLKTFRINKFVIESMNLDVSIFSGNKYKKVELYGDLVPINISDINITNPKIINKIIKLTPSQDGFVLSVEDTLKERLINKIFNRKKEFPINHEFDYNSTVTTPYFNFFITKKGKIDKPIYIKLHGDTHFIYEHIIKNRLKISQLNKNTPLIKISYEDNIPLRATKYVNILVKTFIALGQETKNERTNKVLKFIETQLKLTKAKLKKSEKELKNYKMNNNLIKPSVQTDAYIKMLSDIEIKKSDINLKKNLINNVLSSINQDMELSSIAPYLIELGDTFTVDLLKTLKKSKLEQSNLSLEYTDNYPDLVKVNKNIDILTKQIKNNILSLKKAIDDKSRNLDNIKNRYEKRLLILPANEIDLVNLNKRYEVNSRMYDYLLKKKSEKKMIQVAIVSDYKIVENAYIPHVPIKPKRSLILLASMLVGFIIAMFIAIVYNNFRSGIDTKDDILSNTNLDLYGVIPIAKKRRKRKVIDVFINTQSIFSESFRMLRTNLSFLSAKDNNSSQVILVTSMKKNEGKSTIVSNLGGVCQLFGDKTVVIDLNFRNPSLHKYFDIDYNGGINEYLSGRLNISDVLFATLYQNLDIIPLGSLNFTNPAELIASNRLKILLEKLREEYKYIIIDSTSLSELTDTFPIMKYTDINLFVLRKNYSKKVSLSYIEDIAKKYNLKNVGLIFNKSTEFNIYKN